MDEKRTRRERIDEGLVRVAIAIRTRLATLLKPGSFAIFVAASLFAMGALMKEADFPREAVWENGSPATYALLAVGAITYLGYMLVVWGYRRTISASSIESQLYRACRDVASLVERTTKLPRETIGVHVWTVRGIRGVRRLERRATFVPGDRPPTAIVWRKGKGAIGRCWERDEWVLADLEGLQAEAPDEASFYALPAEERFFLTWPEFHSTDHYKAVLAWPLHGGPEAAPRVVGCLSVDVQEAGATDRLDTFRETQRTLFGDHLALCETVLRNG
jgi:hypothetical protein